LGSESELDPKLTIVVATLAEAKLASDWKSLVTS